VPEIASFTGHSLKHVASILEKLPLTKGQALSAAHKLANHLRTDSANRLQTVAAAFSSTDKNDKPKH
jgi:hypothetical protein